MPKAFWEGFFEGFYKASAILNPLIIFALLALLYYHPYERCERMYDNPNDIMECVWILENN